MEAATLVEHVAAALLRHAKPGDRLTVGLSGGLDSVVLLSLLQRLRDRLDFKLAAYHVNHQISPNAQTWAEFCAGLCETLGVPFQQTTIDVPQNTGKGLEAAARSRRYAAFLALDTDFVVLGHHQDDQVETLLLRLLRGTGVKGLAAMSECSWMPKGGRGETATAPRLLRPLLHLPRATLASFAQLEGLQWIDDESNANVHFTRNYIRAELLPRIEERFPAYRAVLDRAAIQFGEADQLLDTLAALDAKDAVARGRIAVRAFSALDEPRAKNLLRYFLGLHDLKMPDHGRLHEMLRQVMSTRSDAAVCVVHDGVELRRFRGSLYVVHPRPLPSPDLRLRWDGELRWVIPALHGTMFFHDTLGSGIAKAKLLQGEVSVCLRHGGERLRIRDTRPRRTLKNLLQTVAMPPWERERLPLLYIGDALACVPGVGVDTGFQARSDAEGLSLTWVPDDRKR